MMKPNSKASPQARLLSPDFGKHLLEVEDLLQKHALLENDIALQAERVQSASAAALKFANGDSKWNTLIAPLGNLKKTLM